MAKEKKETYIKVRTTKTLKQAFVKKVNKDGITQSEFFIACIINYLGFKTCDENIVKIIEELEW